MPDPQIVQIPYDLILDELREENSRLGYELALTRAKVKVLQLQLTQIQQGDETQDRETEPAIGDPEPPRRKGGDQVN